MEDNQLAGLLIETGRENTNAFNNIFEMHNYSPSEILHRKTNAVFRDTQITCLGQNLWLTFKYDIDGIVATMDQFVDILAPFSYINILSRSRSSLIPIYSIVKKHFKLYNYSTIGKEYMRWSQGFQLFSDYGYQFMFALLPKEGVHDYAKFSRQQLNAMQYQYYEKFRTTLVEICKNLPSSDISRDSFKKNKILDIRSLHILPGDRKFVLKLLDQAREQIMCDTGFSPLIIASKFGDRNSENIFIEEFDVNTAMTTVHAAVTVSSPVLKQNLLWSRDGIQELIGERGTLYSTLSFSSCCNFQTNIDGRCLDISGELRRICTRPEELRFLQFYADIPHIHSPHIHPVFGSIASCGVLHGNIQSTLKDRATNYLSIIEENTLKLGIINARLEVVTIADRKSEVVCSDYLSDYNIKKIIEKHPLIVPFTECIGTTAYTFTNLLKVIPKHLHLTLQDLYIQHESKGGFFPVWKAYQYEVANEVFWNGHPSSYLDNIYSINLGPGGTNSSRCLTLEKGFLCLENFTNCALNEQSTPPLHFWKLNERDKNNIRKIITFSDILTGGNNVVGVRAILLLIQDLLSDPRRTAKCGRSLLSDLKQSTVPAWGSIQGTITLEDLCQKLSRQDQYKPPYVFGRAIQMMEENNLNITEILRAGILHLRIKIFPDIRLRDKSKNQRLHWPGKGVIIIKITDDMNYTADDATVYTANVIDFLEEHNLVHRSKLRSQNSDDIELRFPWMCDILVRLNGLQLQHAALVRLLSYLTTIGLLENHWYVQYKQFAILHNTVKNDMPKLEEILQARDILSRFRLPVIYNIKPLRLHSSLSIVFEEPTKETDAIDSNDVNMEIGSSESSIHEDDETETEDMDTDNHTEHVNHLKRKHAPAGFGGVWKQHEIEIMDLILSLRITSEKEAFAAYQRECTKNDIPDRSFAAFKAKYHRLQAAAKTKTRN